MVPMKMVFIKITSFLLDFNRFSDDVDDYPGNQDKQKDPAIRN